jgi:hypothetical protein
MASAHNGNLAPQRKAQVQANGKKRSSDFGDNTGTGEKHWKNFCSQLHML